MPETRRRRVNLVQKMKKNNTTEGKFFVVLNGKT